MRDSSLWSNHAYDPIPRACIVGGCPHRAVPGRSRCRHHGPKAPARTGPNPYDYQHQRDGAEVLAEATHCGICGRPLLPGQAVQADHIIPLSMGGRRTKDNLQAAHRYCNISKGGRNRLR